MINLEKLHGPVERCGQQPQSGRFRLENNAPHKDSCCLNSANFRPLRLHSRTQPSPDEVANHGSGRLAELGLKAIPSQALHEPGMAGAWVRAQPGIRRLPRHSHTQAVPFANTAPRNFPSSLKATQRAGLGEPGIRYAGPISLPAVSINRTKPSLHAEATTFSLGWNLAE